MALADLMKIPEFEKFRSRKETFDFMDQIVDRNGLPPERWKELLDLTDAVYDGVIEVKDMPELLAQAFGIEGRRIDKLVRELIAVQLAPMKDLVPGLAAQIQEWHATIPQRDDSPQTYEEYAELLAARANISLPVHHIRRFSHLLRQYITGERTREQTSESLVRPITIGGLAFTDEQAAIILQFIDEDKGKVKFVDDAQPATEAPAPTAPAELRVALTPHAPVAPAPVETPKVEQNLPEIAPSHALATETPVAAKPPGVAMMGPRLRGDNQDQKDAKEIAAHEKKLARIAQPPDDERMKTAIEASVNAASPTLARFRLAKKRFADIARMAIKGVRDPYQTRGIIERDLGITGDAVLELIEAVMLGMENYHKTDMRRETWDMGAPTSQGSRLTSESHVLDKQFAAVAGAMPKEPVAPVMPEARVSAARTKEEELAEQAAKIAPAKLEAAAAASKPVPAVAKLTVGSVPPVAAGEMPVVIDVQFKPRLVGPVEELGTMAPADFRRLSSNADEAARKILDLLHALEATSYEDRIRGVQAWRQSPVNRLYAFMASEALNNGIALAEVASRRRNKGDESLSPAELRAVANINAAIRF